MQLVIDILSKMDWLDYLGVMIIIAFILLMLMWIMWIFALGRFYQARYYRRGYDHGVWQIIIDFFANVIDDFRHLLALAFVLIFASTLGFCLFKAGGNLKEITNMLQAVVGTFGGLMGAIIGFYFSEKRHSQGRAMLADVVQIDEPSNTESDPSNRNSIREVKLTPENGQPEIEDDSDNIK